MKVHSAVQSAGVIAACVFTVGLLAGCSGSSSGSGSGSGSGAGAGNAGAQNTASPPGGPASSAVAATGGAGSGSGAKCSDLTAAIASKALGKATTVTLDTSTSPLPGLTICNVTIDGEVYPIQLAVDTNNAQTLFTADKDAFSGVDLSGVGDKAFSSAVGVEVLSGSVDIKVTGPAGPVLDHNYTIPTAIAKAMSSTLQ